MAVVGVSACSDDNNGLDIPQELHPEAGYITLNLNCVEGTRATEDGVETYNENKINTVTICLWANDGTKPDATAKPDYVQTFTAVNEQNSATLRIPLTEPLKKVLFESDPAKCNVFAAVNVTPPPGDFTIAEFRKMAIASTFSSQILQNSFAMDGDNEVTYDRAKNVATGTISLQRSASKLTLALSVDPQVEQSVVVDGELITSKWQPDTENMRVWINGALSESQLDPDMSATPGPGYFFNTPDNLTYKFKKNTQNPHKAGEFTYDNEQDMPFYTYPHRWSAEPGDYAATYMTLAIPWMRVNDDGTQVAGSTWRTCYYQVPVISENSDVLELVRNVAYHIYLHVGLLGSFIPDEPLLLENLEYSAAEWGSVNMDVNIPDVRYLVVDQNDYTVNNETSIAIPFYTSHETVVTDATMTFYRYNFDDVGSERAVPVTMAKNEESMKTHNGIAGAPVFSAEFNNETKELLVSHDLVMFEGYEATGTEPVSFTSDDKPTTEDRAPKTDAQWQSVINSISYFRKQQPTALIPDVNEYSRVEFVITLQHKDMKDTPNFKEEITITQYPGMYITAVQNYWPSRLDSDGKNDANGAEGNTYINNNSISYSPFSPAYVEDGRTATDHRPSVNVPSGWMTSIGLNSGNFNYNPNMYLVTVTTLPEDTPYRIGDPRSNEINNYLASANRDYNPTSLLNRQPTASNFYNTNYSENVQRNYTKALITTGVNNSLAPGENKTLWTGNTYSWYVWDGNQISSSNSVTCRGFTNARAISTNNTRSLSFYYPTLEDDAHKMMIAPKFRICSSYGGTTWILNRELARRRAAAYQEMGYPAGRWRLPTFGEVAFIMDLAAQYKIPRLFGTRTSTWWYWCAQGLVCVPSKQSGKTNATLPDDADFELPTYSTARANANGARDCQRARFVYDEWYWGESDLPHTGTIGSADCVYTFTWGDKQY